MIQELLLAETFIEQRNTLGLVTLIIVVCGVIFWKYEFLRHPRRRCLFAFPGAIALILFPLSFQEVIPISVAFAGFFLSSAMAFVLYEKDVNVLWPCTVILKRSYSDLNAFQDEEAQKQLEQSKWLFITSLEKLHLKLIEAELIAIHGGPRKAYEFLVAIDETPLFENERHLLRLRRAKYAMQLNNPKQVRLLIEKTSPFDDDTALEKAYRWSWYLEKQGRLREASESLHEALLNHPNPGDKQILCKIYNNLGRLRKFEESVSSSLKYYETAAKIASEMNYKGMLHVSYQNVIHSYGLLEQFDVAELWLQRYREYIDRDDSQDLLEWFNVLLEYHRQRRDINAVVRTMREHREQFTKMLAENELLFFDISELRILVNSNMHYMDQLFLAQNRYEQYLKMELHGRYRALKEIHMATQRACDSGLRALFGNFHLQVTRDLANMQNEIHEHYVLLPEYCVDESCYWIKELATLEKLGCNGGNFDRLIQTLNDVKRRYLEFENRIDALSINLDICDEAIYRKEHGVVKEYLQKTLEELKTFQGHPIEDDCFIRIAYYAYKLKDRQTAKQYLEKFNEKGISIYHYADWIQAYYHHLTEQLTNT
jgi:hypothetical protein